MNPLIEALVTLLEEMNGAQDSNKMVTQVHDLFIAVNKAKAEEVDFLIKQLRTMKDGA